MRGQEHRPAGSVYRERHSVSGAKSDTAQSMRGLFRIASVDMGASGRPGGPPSVLPIHAVVRGIISGIFFEKERFRNVRNT